MAASQRQLQRYIFILKALMITNILHLLLSCHVIKRVQFSWTKHFEEKYKHAKLALNFVKKQYFR